MPRKNSPSDKDQELNELIARYEAAKAESKQLYLDGDQLADIADKYATDQRFSDAQEVITYGLELHPGHTDLMVEQAYLYLDTMQLQKAKNVVECITETYDISVKLMRAEILLNEGKVDDAENELNTIEDQDSLDTILDISYLYVDMGYPEKALPWLTRGIVEFQDNEDFLVAIANCYHNADHNERAIYFYDKLIDKNPYNSSYWTGLARCNFATQEFDKAIEACDFALTADDTCGEAHTLKAHSLFHLENETEAIEEYRLALEGKALPPEIAYMFIGLAYANLENWKLGHESYQKALEFIEDNNSLILPDIYSNEAFCLSKLGRYEEAHQACEKAKKIVPNSAEIYLQEGRIYLEEENFDKAKESWGLALHHSPEAETLVQIGNYSLDYGMVENARLCFEEALMQDPDYPEINGRLASICLILKDHKSFYKYNQMSETPLDMKVIYDNLSQSPDTSILEDLKKFMDEVSNIDSESRDKDINN